jgi:hypothetical protein
MPSKLSWSCVLWEFEQAISATERVIEGAKFIAEDSWEESDYGIDHDHCRDFAAIENKVSNADFFGFEDINHSLIKSFIAATEEHDSLGSGQFLGEGLIQPSALGCHH